MLLLTYLRPPPCPLPRDARAHTRRRRTAPPPPSLRSPDARTRACPPERASPPRRARGVASCGSRRTIPCRAYEDPNRPRPHVLAIGSSMLHATPLMLIAGLPVRAPVLRRGAPEPHVVYTYLHVLYSSMYVCVLTHAHTADAPPPIPVPIPIPIPLPASRSVLALAQ